MILFSGVACEVAEVAQALQIADFIILQTMQSVWYEKNYTEHQETEVETLQLDNVFSQNSETLAHIDWPHVHWIFSYITEPVQGYSIT